MTKLIVIALGVVLVAAGGAFAVQGYGIVEVERGWAAVIAGATAMSAGFVVIAIGALIGAVDRLRRDTQATPRPIARAARRNEPPPAQTPPAVEAPEMIIPRAAEAVIAPVAAPEPTAAPAVSEPPQEPPQIGAPAPEPAGDWIEQALTRIEPGAEAPRSPLSPGKSDPKPAASAFVVGRYTFGGANYALYNDGSIEAETPNGPRRFASLAELRAHLSDIGK